MERFFYSSYRAIICAPAPDEGRAGARGMIISHETGFLQSKKKNNYKK
jgi:hypothetical protein